MPKHVIPFGDRILVKRRKIGEKLGTEGLILAADDTKERPTDLADVVYVPDHTFADKKLADNADEIIENLTEEAKGGNSEALVALIKLNQFLKIKSIKPGDGVMIGKYVGTDFHDTNSSELLTLVDSEQIIGLVVDE